MTADPPVSERLKGTALKLPSGPVRSQSPEPIDLLALAGPSVAARAVPVAAIAAIVGSAAAPQRGVRWVLAAVAAALVATLGRQARGAARR